MKFEDTSLESLYSDDYVHRVGIIGAGWVGTACELGFAAMKNTEVYVHDKYKPSESLHSVVDNSDILFMCLPTPMQEDGSCDVSIVAQTIDKVATIARTTKQIVIKSTVTPGTTAFLQDMHPEHNIFFNPEFLTEANFIADFCNQEFIILGQPSWRNKDERKLLNKFYEDFSEHQKHTTAQILWTCCDAAELAKYTINCFLASKVTFFNEIYQIAKTFQIDYNEVVKLVKQDKRLGTSHMQVPGPDGKLGFGNRCFPKDLNALMHFAKSYGVDPKVLKSVWDKNLEVRDDRDWENIPGATHLKRYG